MPPASNSESESAGKEKGDPSAFWSRRQSRLGFVDLGELPVEDTFCNTSTVSQEALLETFDPAHFASHSYPFLFEYFVDMNVCQFQRSVCTELEREIVCLVDLRSRKDLSGMPSFAYLHLFLCF